MIVRIKRLYNAKASLRDYQVSKALLKNESLTVICDKKRMTLTVEALKHPVSTGPTCKSQYVRGSYRLIDYLFIEDKRDEPEKKTNDSK